MRGLLAWVVMSLGVGTVIALIRMAVYAYLYRRVRRMLRHRPSVRRPRTEGNGTS